MTKKQGGLVYSTELGRTCRGCQRAVGDCRCSRTATVTTGDGIVRVSRETKGRKGKGVTLITGVPLAGEALSQLAKKLKARCGSGGTVKDGVIEIQGDHRDALIPLLEASGWKVKRAGG